WVLALVISAAVRRALHRTTLDKRLVEWLSTDRETPVNAAAWISRIVYYVLMLFVVVGVLQVLGLTAMSTPLDNLLTQVLQALPRLFGAALLLLVAWIVASLLKMVVHRALSAARVDERLAGSLEAGAQPAPVAATVADAVYWLVFLFFLPGILDALALEGLLAPVQGLVDRLLGFLPNLLAAGLLLAFGWFGARIVRNIVTNLLTSLGADRFSKDVGLTGVLGERPVSSLLGLIVYVLVLVPVVVAALNALRLEAVTEPTSAMLTTILAALPAIFAALLLLGVAYVVGRLVATLAVDLLRRVGFDTLAARLGIRAAAPEEGAGTPDGRSPSEIAGWVILTVIMLFAAIEAADLLRFNQIARLLTNFVSFLGQIVLVLAIFGAGLYLAGAASRQILAAGGAQAPVLATAARIAIIILAATMGLRQMGLADEIITLAFGLILGAVAVAAAIAFGLGGRDIARALLEDWRDSLGSRSKRPPADPPAAPPAGS